MSREKKTAVGVATPATEIDKQSTDIINQAIEKINPKSIKNANRYMKVVAEPVAKALHGFCRQSEEFARAITETDVTFQECLEYIRNTLDTIQPQSCIKSGSSGNSRTVSGKTANKGIQNGYSGEYQRKGSPNQPEKYF